MRQISPKDAFSPGRRRNPARLAANPQPLAIVGPSAAGKSDVACALAQALAGPGRPAEVLACDSVQIYRGFDCGSGKPSGAQRAAVRHHLLDLCPPAAPFDAAAWCAAARPVLADLAQRGGWSLICGGTGLYLRALCRGLVSLPAAPTAARLSLRQSLLSQGQRDPRALHARLQALDPPSAAALHPHSLAHVISALEICLHSGQPASAVRAAQRAAAPPWPLPTFYLAWPDALLRARIARRSAAMLAAGLLAEVEGLLARGVPEDCRPMRSVGYRECVECLRRGGNPDGLAEQISARTWAYARRQRTWWRREPQRVCIETTDVQGAVAQILTHLSRLGPPAAPGWPRP